MRFPSRLGAVREGRAVVFQVGAFHSASGKPTVVPVGANELAFENADNVRRVEGVEEKLVGVAGGFGFGLNQGAVNRITRIQAERSSPVDNHDGAAGHFVFMIPSVSAGRSAIREDVAVSG